MAATTLTPQVVPGFNTGLLSTTLVAPDAVNGNAFNNDGRTALLVVNASASPITITWTLPPSPRNANGNFGTTQVQTVPASKTAVLGFLDPGTYNNSSGVATFTASTATSVTVAACQFLPSAL